ncbi:MAG: hypothetical protein NC331_05190 [Lachnospiraceae bacterium]|nr:hypothetical protein [Lachnospiraceae bacterium]MCM1238761.1 hypothetical protein [Lachnospiraceae bacterium]
MYKRVMVITLMFLCMFGLIWGGNGCRAFAVDIPLEEGALSGDVRMLKQESGRYVMQVTVENSGEDFAGTVQAIFSADYDNCAYHTEIDLPAQGRKQFTVTVPERAADAVNGACQLNFLDEEGNVVQSVFMRDVFNDITSGIPVGILSDRYLDLTFMDAGGEPFYIRGLNYPLELVELDNDNLTGYLDGLYFLIIDQFNTSTLSDENIQAIQDWVAGGGWLIVGTGEYAEQTLSGFGEDFLDVDVLGVSEPGEENIAMVNADRYGYYYDYIDQGIDFGQMAMADLDYDRMYAYTVTSESGANPAFSCAIGDGAVLLLYFSLGEEELQKMSSDTIQSIYQETMYLSGSYQNISNNSDLEYVGQRALAFIDSRNSDVDFSWLKALILVYVVLVGPILYLVLRKCRKSEWYWVGAPALGILFIVGVFLFGRGLNVKDARVYSVTVQQADNSQADTYMLAYHSGVEPWKLYLRDEYEVAGPGFLGYGYYSRGGAAITDYHYIVGNDSQGLSVGLKPRENFENGFLYAGKRAESVGSFIGTDLKGLGIGSPEGTIINGTGRDLAYMAVWNHTYIMVFSDVRAGETVDLQQAVRDGRCVYQDAVPYFDNLLYSMVGIHGNFKDYAQDDMAALLIGLGVAEEKSPQQGAVIVAGVVEDYDKAVADRCNETAFGCIYSYIKTGTGGGRYAAD